MAKDRQKFFLIGLIVLFLLPSSLSASEWEIHTFGGGELLTNVFNMVKLIFYGNSKTGIGAAFNSFSRIILALGSISGVFILIFKQNPAFYFKNFLLPSFVVLNILLVPRTDIVIHDEAVRNSSNSKLSSISVVQNVPFLYGAFISLLSELSHNFTRLLEHCTHQVNDPIYNWTGRIYAGEYALKIRLDSIWDRDTESNFREFCRDCVWSDIERGLYSRNELLNASDLLGFLKARTSNLNTMKYLSFDDKKSERKFLTCREAIALISNSLSTKKPLNKVENFIGRYIPTTVPSGNQAASQIINTTLHPQEADLNFLLGQSQTNSLNNLRLQSGIIRLLKEELPGTQTTFVAKRAEAQNREGMKTTGAVAASTLVSMKNVFEALIYFSFPLVCLFALVPLMHHLIFSWMKACIWIATLAPFYVIINSILSFLWTRKRELLMGVHANLTLYSYDGLLDLYDSMEAVAALAIGSIFTISLILTRSGFTGLTHALPSLFSSGQSAAYSAAAEKVSGNYSFGNVSLSNAQAYNYDAFKQNYSGSLSQGGVSVNEVSQTTTRDLGSGTSFVHQETSKLRDSISRTEGFGSSVQTQLANVESTIEEQSAQFSESAAATANHSVGLMEAYSQQKQSGTSVSSNHSSGVNQTFQSMDNLAKEYSQNHNLSYDQSLRELSELGLSLPIIKIGGRVNTSDGVSEVSGVGSNERYAQAESYSKLLQELGQYSESEIGSVLQNVDSKQHEEFTDSWNKTASLSEHVRSSLTKQANLSHLESSMQSDNLSVHHNLDQQFVDFLRDKYDGDMGSVNKALNSPSGHTFRMGLVDEFISDYKPSEVTDPNIQAKYESNTGTIYKHGHGIREAAPSGVPEKVPVNIEKESNSINENLLNLKEKRESFELSSYRDRLQKEGKETQRGVEETSFSDNLEEMKGKKILNQGIKGAKMASKFFGQYQPLEYDSDFIHYYAGENEQ